jgi:hypothetical protein
MPRMIDLIRASQVPSNLMQSAARGSLSVPPAEMIEILVHLSLHHKVFGAQARLTLAGWDEKACLSAAQDSSTSPEVLGYWVSPENLRIPLLAALTANPSIKEETLHELAARGTRAVVEVLISSPRILNSKELLEALHSNPNLRPPETAQIETRLGASHASPAGTPQPVEESDKEIEEVLDKYLKDNAAELETVKNAPFHALGDPGHQTPAPAEGAHATAEAKDAAAGASHASHAAAAAHPKKVAHESPEEKRDSTVQKIAKLDVKGRIALAVRGSKEERSILIRDMTKVVCLAVLDSPKLTDAEVEGFAQQKNVLDWVLRTIPMKRRFAKNYTVQRNLAFNPRTPTDAALGLMKNLLVHDLKNLSENKEVADPIRKLAFRLYRQKMERHKS